MSNEVSLVVPNLVFSLPRTKLTIDGGRVVTGETRRRGDRVARRVAETKLVSQRQSVIEVFFKLQSDEIGIKLFEVTTSQAVERIARHGCRAIAKFHKRIVGHRDPGDSVVREVVLLEFVVADREAGGFADA